MNFSETESYLYSLGNEVETMKLGLENIRVLLTALGNPEKQYKKVQVAGTNGKGSVCAFLHSICLEAGIKTGLYTSPHLISITERIKIDGADISENEFARFATQIRKKTEELAVAGELQYFPTFFEQVTAIGLLAFAETNVELAILETGLGGRYDATTVVNADITALTRIDLDHQEYLGDTIEKISAEKAAIIHSSSVAVIGHQSDAAMKIILERCSEVSVEPSIANEVVFPSVRLGLRGIHQIENAKVAMLIAEKIQAFFPITAENIVDGLETAKHPGRLEYVGKFLLDGAHNVAGAISLAAYLDEFVDKPITIIFGAMRDKNIREIAKILWPKANRLILTTPSNSRAMTANELKEYVPTDFDYNKVVLLDSVGDALLAAAADEFVLVTGSLYLVGELKILLNN